MAKHRRTPEVPVKPAGGRHRGTKEESVVVKRSTLGFVAAVGLSTLLGTAFVESNYGNHKPVADSTPDTDPTQSPKSPTSSPSIKPSKAPGREQYGDCPAPDKTLVARYSNHNQVAMPQIARFDTSNGIAAIQEARATNEMLADANTALRGKITVRFATHRDYTVPNDNLDMTDRPLPSSAIYTTPVEARETITGLLEAYDGKPEALGTLDGYPLSVVLTDHIAPQDPKDKTNISGGFNGEDGSQGYLMLKLGRSAEATKATTMHESGHYVHEAGTGTVPEVDCFRDPYLTHTSHLTE